MDFPREYFRPEVRDGFYVDGSMKRAWASSLQVTTDVFAKVCSEYNIKWYADYGTLLGAVRHHGFIPWDDDIDIAMLRDDYRKFKSVMYDAFPPDYCISTYDSSESSNWEMIIRVMNSKTICFDSDFLSNNFDCPYPMGIDIFPIDYIPDDDEEAEEYRNLCYMLVVALGLKEELDNPDNEKTVIIKKAIEDNFGYRFKNDESIELQCFRLAEAVFSMYKKDECSRAVMLWDWALGNSVPIDRKMFDHPIKVSFEGVELPAVSDTDAYLRVKYGDNYMIQNRDFPSHDYPFFKSMEKDVINYLGYDPFNYHLDDEGIMELKRQSMPDIEASENQKRVLFVVPKASDWKYMQFYYEEKMREGSGISVMPIPFSDCDFFENPIDKVCEYDDFPQDLPLIDYSESDIENGLYDEIVIAWPYDRYNNTELIDTKYFASELRKRTKHLTYISPFETDDTQAQSQRDQKAMMYYVTVPALIYADKIYVQSVTMKDGYIKRILDSYDDEIYENHELASEISRKEVKKIFLKKIQIRG